MKTSYWINIVLISWTFHTFYYIFEIENRPRLYLIVLSSKNNIHSTFIFWVYIIDLYFPNLIVMYRYSNSNRTRGRCYFQDVYYQILFLRFEFNGHEKWLC